jgi:manganese efflux pump family protein
MNTITLIGIALGLAMDAFAVSIGVGLTLKKVDARQTFRLAWHFGLFQALMPIIGWLAGMTVEHWIAPVDHWIAFGLLAAVGGKMIYESFQDDADEVEPVDPTRGVSLVVLSVATSIDALAVGLSLAVLDVQIWYPAVVIGVVAGVLTTIGIRLGSRFGVIFGRRMETVGGLVLLAIGVNILVEHMG